MTIFRQKVTFEDGICDDRNNIEQCYFDKNDCCNPEANQDFCSDCQCKDQNSPYYLGKSIDLNNKNFQLHLDRVKFIKEELTVRNKAAKNIETLINVLRDIFTVTKTQWHSRLQTLPKMISSLFRRTQKSLGCLEIRNSILKMKILVWCAQKNCKETVFFGCFLRFFEVYSFQT